MHIAILMTNTDESDFAQTHPKDGDKFQALLRRVRPDWTFEVFSVKDGVFPADLAGFDGAMITGSPASVRSGAAWVDTLLDLIRDASDRALPLFGACFGHQAIAMAMGGEVGPNAQGWVHGLTHNDVVRDAAWTRDLPRNLKLYGSHAERVTVLPPKADILFRAPDGTVTGFAVGRSVYTTQHHPEMTPDFIAALTEELAGELGPDVTACARESLTETADMDAFAESIARFFEEPRT